MKLVGMRNRHISLWESGTPYLYLHLYLKGHVWLMSGIEETLDLKNIGRELGLCFIVTSLL